MIELQDIYYIHYILSVNKRWGRLLYRSGLAKILAKTAVFIFLKQRHNMALTAPAATIIIEMTCVNKDTKKARNYARGIFTYAQVSQERMYQFYQR
jgi:hypothetical protein